VLVNIDDFRRGVVADLSSSIIDVVDGESTLVDDLLALGCENITVQDISRIVIDASRKRLRRL